MDNKTAPCPLYVNTNGHGMRRAYSDEILAYPAVVQALVEAEEKGRRMEREEVVDWLCMLHTSETVASRRALLWRCLETIHAGVHLSPPPTEPDDGR